MSDDAFGQMQCHLNVMNNRITGKPERCTGKLCKYNERDGKSDGFQTDEFCLLKMVISNEFTIKFDPIADTEHLKPPKSRINNPSQNGYNCLYSNVYSSHPKL